MRDSLLQVSGQLDSRLGGQPVAAALDDPNHRRRSIYLLIDRQHTPELAQVFDIPSPDLTSPGRTSTTVPQQQLFMMNNRFVIAAAESVVAHMRQDKDAADDRSRVKYLYRQILAREATQREMDRMAAYVRQEPDAVQQSILLPSQSWLYGFGNYDRQRQTIMGLTELPHFNGSSWQGGPEWPDPELHHLRLTDDGGHVGIDPEHAAVRRWVSPLSGTVTVRGTLTHGIDDEMCGDGIEAWIVSSRHGQLGQWQLHDKSAETRVESVVVAEGDTIDFVVSCLTNHSCDLFAWAPTIQQQVKSGESRDWDAARDFGGHDQSAGPLDVWSKVAQVLLQSNEFMFID